MLQAVGFLTLALLALYGVLAFAGGAGPLPGALSARAQGITPQDAAPDANIQAVAAPNGTAPQTVNYQGFVRDANGKLINGTFNITARIWTTATGGELRYVTTVQNVLVRDGLFNMVLGEFDPAELSSAFDNAGRYIGISLNDGAEIIPQQRVHSVPFAMNATNATNATTASTLVQDAQVGNVAAQNLSATTSIWSGYIETPGLTVMTRPPGGTAKLTVWGDAQVGGTLNTNEATVNGNLTATTATVSGNLTAGNASVNGNLTTKDMTVNGKLRVARQYRAFAASGADSDQSMGNWDICTLAIKDSGETCGVYLVKGGKFGALDTILAPGERMEWRLWVHNGTCYFICMNITPN